MEGGAGLCRCARPAHLLLEGLQEPRGLQDDGDSGPPGVPPTPSMAQLGPLGVSPPLPRSWAVALTVSRAPWKASVLLFLEAGTPPWSLSGRLHWESGTRDQAHVAVGPGSSHFTLEGCHAVPRAQGGAWGEWAQSSHGRVNLGSPLPFYKTPELTRGECVAPSLPAHSEYSPQ